MRGQLTTKRKMTPDYIGECVGWLHDYRDSALVKADEMEKAFAAHPDQSSPQAQALHALARAHTGAAAVYRDAADRLAAQAREEAG